MGTTKKPGTKKKVEQVLHGKQKKMSYTMVTMLVHMKMHDFAYVTLDSSFC